MSLATHVEYAKSNRSECVKCHRPIPKDAIRIGKQFHANHEGQRYYHLKCWNPKDKTQKPADYVFGFEHLKPADQIIVNKHCGFENEAVVDPDRHVVGASSSGADTQSSALPSTTTAAFAPSSPQAAPAATSFSFSSSTAPSSSSFSFSSQQSTLSTSAAPSSPFSQQSSLPSSAAIANATTVTPTTSSSGLSSVNGDALLSSNSLFEAIASLGLPTKHLLDNAFLLKPDARQVFEGAYELFTYDRDVEEFLHTVGRILRA